MAKRKNVTTVEKIPRSRKISLYKYTVDEFLALLVACDDVVLLYDVCDMTEYQYTRIAMARKDVKQYANSNDTMLNSIFGAFTLNTDKYLKHRTDYWQRLVPGGNSLEMFVHEDEEECEWATTKLDMSNLKCGNHVFMDCVPLVHSIPIGAVHSWLKFVGRQFSKIPLGDKTKHKPFPTAY